MTQDISVKILRELNRRHYETHQEIMQLSKEIKEIKELVLRYLEFKKEK